MNPTLSRHEQERSVLIHIGPRKTGTTAIQAAFASRRDELRTLGVVYPTTPKTNQHFRAANRLMGRRQMWEEDHEGAVAEAPWQALVAEIGDAPFGVVSTEILSQARQHHVRRIVDSFGGRAPTIVITYRPFEELLSSTWQQLVKEGLREPLDAWSRRTVVERPEDSDAPFPRVLDLASLVETWGGVVGADNVAIVLVDRTKPTAIFDAFQQLLALPEGFLTPEDTDSRKRSLSAQEAELLRLINTLLPRDANSLKQQRQLRGVVARWLDRHPPSAHDTRLELPEDVVIQARARTDQMIGELRSTWDQVTVFGDLETLVSTGPTAKGDAQPPATVDPDLAAHWLASVIGFLPTGDS